MGEIAYVAYVAVAVMCWPILAFVLIRCVAGRGLDAGDMMMGTMMGGLAAVLWPISMTAVVVGLSLHALFRRLGYS